jgi:hypothetical protein
MKHYTMTQSETDTWYIDDASAHDALHDALRDAHPGCEIYDADGIVVDVVADDMGAYKWAVAEQGFDGTYQEWMDMDADERAEYEDGAQGIGTV